jgi:hypothetical protein
VILSRTTGFPSLSKGSGMAPEASFQFDGHGSPPAGVFRASLAILNKL